MAKQNDLKTLPGEESFDYSSHKGQGLENAPMESIPEFRLIQPTTPEIMDSTNVLYGVSPGNILNVLSKELLTSIDVVPCYIRQMYTVFQGFKNTKRSFLYSSFDRPSGYKYDKDKGMHDVTGRTMDRSVVVLGLYCKGAEVMSPFYIKFGGTNTKVAFNWLKVLNASMDVVHYQAAYIPPAYARIFSLETEKMQNEGVTWFQWKLNHIYTWVNPRSELFKLGEAATNHLRRYFNTVLVNTAEETGVKIISDDIPF